MIYVLYHKDCADGFAAAYAAYLRFKGKAIYLPTQYSEPVPEMPNATELYILDFSFSKETILKLVDQLEKVMVIDHHQTAEKELALFSEEICLFDMKRSGCMMAWEYFFPNQDPPSIFYYIQDRDLWRWEMPHSREINAALPFYMTEKSFATLDTIVANWESSLRETFIRTGTILLESQEQVVKRLAEKAELVNFRGHAGVPCLNSCTLQSELGEKLLSWYPDASFAVIYFHPALNKRVYSLRSRKGEFDVSELAKQFGGGGHASAAGFSELFP